jgi:predicted solute-binding protein
MKFKTVSQQLDFMAIQASLVSVTELLSKYKPNPTLKPLAVHINAAAEIVSLILMENKPNEHAQETLDSV